MIKSEPLTDFFHFSLKSKLVDTIAMITMNAKINPMLKSVQID